MNVMKIGLPLNCSLTYLGIKLVDTIATATYLQMLENLKMSMRRWSSKPNCSGQLLTAVTETKHHI
jgi:hypothetical protein